MLDKWIHKLDRYLKTDSWFLLHGGGWSVFAKIISSILLLGLSVILARYLSKEFYGTYKYVLSILSMLGFATLPGVYTSYIRSAARDDLAYMRRGVHINFMLSYLLTLAGLITSLYFFYTGNITIGILLVIASFLAPLEEGTKGFVGWLLLTKQFRSRAFYVIIYNLVNVFAMSSTVLYIYVKGLELLTAAILLLGVYFISRGIVRGTYLLRSLKHMPKLKEGTQEKETVRYGIHLSISKILSPVSVHIDNILLFAFLGPTSLAIYSFATIIPDQLKGLILSIKPIAQPKIFRKDTNIGLLPTKILKATLFISIGVAFYILLAPYIYNILFPRYLDSIAFSRVIALSLLAIPFSAILDTAIDSMGDIKKVYMVNISTQIIQILSVLILVFYFGIWGAVFARLFTRFYNALLLVYLTRQQ